MYMIIIASAPLPKKEGVNVCRLESPRWNYARRVHDEQFFLISIFLQTFSKQKLTFSKVANTEMSKKEITTTSVVHEAMSLNEEVITLESDTTELIVARGECGPMDLIRVCEELSRDRERLELQVDHLNMLAHRRPSKVKNYETETASQVSTNDTSMDMPEGVDHHLRESHKFLG